MLHNEHVIRFYFTQHCDSFGSDDFEYYTMMWIAEDERNEWADNFDPDIPF